MNTETYTTRKIENDYAGNAQHEVLVDGVVVAVIAQIARENVRHFSSSMTYGRRWVIRGRRGIHFVTKTDAATAAARWA